MIDENYMRTWEDFLNSCHKVRTSEGRETGVMYKKSLPTSLFLKQRINAESSGISLKDVVIDDIVTGPAKTIGGDVIGVTYFLKGSGFTIELDRIDSSRPGAGVLHYTRSPNGLPVVETFNEYTDLRIEILSKKK